MEENHGSTLSIKRSEASRKKWMGLSNCFELALPGALVKAIRFQTKKSIPPTKSVVYYALHLLPDKARVGDDRDLPNALLHLSRRSQRKPE